MLYRCCLRESMTEPPEGNMTLVGTDVEVVVPFASSPRALLPQQYSNAVVVIPQVCWNPLLTNAKVSVVSTRTGAIAHGIAEAAPASRQSFGEADGVIPMSPKGFDPQQ